MSRHRTVILFVCALVAVAGWLAWENRGWLESEASGRAGRVRAHGAADRQRAAVVWTSYGEARAASDARRNALAAKWKIASAERKPALLQEAAAALTETVAMNLAPFWYGTRWD